MSTSAKDRLDKIFANKARPAKPDPVPSPTSGITNQAHQLTSTSPSSVNPTSKPTGSNVRTTSPPKSLALASSDDDDDEYISMFAKKPEMKAKSVKSRPRLEVGNVAEFQNTNPGALNSIEFIPEGRKSAAKLKSVEVTGESQNGLEKSHDYDEQAITGRFCPLSLVAKFPYKYMKDPSDRVSKKFFANNRFYDREWHLYYLHPPQSFDRHALLLIPYTQVKQLVDEISTAFQIQVKVPPFPFTVDFYDDGTPQPVFLGKSSSREDVNELTEKVPGPTTDHAECPSQASSELVKIYEAYHTKIEKVILASKGKSSASSEKKVGKLFQTLQESRNQLKRAERYFGLRPPTKAIESVSNLSWEEDKTYKQTQQKSCGLLVSYLDPRNPVKYPFEQQPVIISIDVEAYERNHTFVTEIGISTLDTLDLLDLPPGFSGEEWVKQIRSRHFRVKGREHLVNKDFCVGNPDAFEFGKSEFVDLGKVSDAVDSCFEWPFSAGFRKSGTDRQIREFITDADSKNDVQSRTQKGSRERNIILLGHDIGTDISYLQKLGSVVFDPLASVDDISSNPASSQRQRILTSLLETLDTALLYKTIKGEPQPRSLGHVCTNLGIDTWFLHNAGNDARYTLEAFVKLIIKARLEEDEQQRKRDPNAEGIIEDEWEAEQMRQADRKLEHARQKVQKKLVQNSDNIESINDVRTQPEKSEGDVDWSLPFRGERTLKTKKHRSPEQDTKKSKQGHHELQEEAAAGIGRAIGRDRSVPKHGW